MTNLILPPPDGATDCHMHVFGEHARYRLKDVRSYTPPPALLDGYLARMAPLGLTRTVFVQASAYGGDNSCQADALGEHGMARGIAGIDPDTSPADIAQLDRAGFRGVRINCVSRSETDPARIFREIRAVHDRITAFGWHIQLFIRAEVLEALEPDLAALDCPLVFDHIGLPSTCSLQAPGMGSLMRLIEKNAWLKLAGADRLQMATGADDAAVAALMADLITARPERMVWGSDWPHTGKHPGRPVADAPVIAHRPVDIARLLNILARACADEQRYHAVLRDNPAALYGFASPEKADPPR